MEAIYFLEPQVFGKSLSELKNPDKLLKIIDSYSCTMWNLCYSAQFNLLSIYQESLLTVSKLKKINKQFISKAFAFAP